MAYMGKGYFKRADTLVKNLYAIQETACNTGDANLTPESGKSPGVGNGNPLYLVFLPGESWQVTVHGVTKELDMSD